MSFSVKVAKPSTPARSVELNDGATVGDAIRDAGFTVGSNEVAQRNGSSCTLSDRVYAGDMIVIAAGAKGNASREAKAAKANSKAVKAEARDTKRAAKQTKRSSK